MTDLFAIPVLTAPAFFLAGSASSLHCSLMCGGYALQKSATARLRPAPALLYLHAGRIAGYAALGGASAVAGRTLLHALPTGWVEAVPLATSAVAITAGLWMLLRDRQASACCAAPALRPSSRRWPEPLQLLLRGAVWSLLPCGLLYSMLLLAAFSRSIASGAILAAAFAAGGAPMLMTVSLLSAHPRFRANVARRLAGIWLIAVGCAGLMFQLGGRAAFGWLCLGRV